ncbi:hypothetical protein HDU76_004070 [Blyttiomyces sp. JEL0837]|nr:hypothetical protein HDU76_004070 [Blyttiomyces sp. JEL0837]
MSVSTTGVKSPIFNLHVNAPHDAFAGSHIEGSVTFDVTGFDLTDLQSIVVKFECLEYTVLDPSHTDHHDHPTPVAKARHHHSLFHSKKHAAAGLSDHKTRFSQSVEVYKAKEAHESIHQGRQDFKFKMDLPAQLEATGAVKTPSGDAALILYRLHAQVIAGKIIEARNIVLLIIDFLDGYAVLHILPKEH